MKKMNRRTFIKTGASAAAATLAAPALPRGWYSLPGADAPGYFEREFGITDGLCRKVLAEALAKGGDYADLYFEHTISNYLILEDGKVNRAVSDIALGVGIRTVKGDQVGYGFTQELSDKAMLTCRGDGRHDRQRPAQAAGRAVCPAQDQGLLSDEDPVQLGSPQIQAAFAPDDQ